jgi:hypothetical protein
MQVLLYAAGSEFPAAGLTGERGCFPNLQAIEKEIARRWQAPLTSRAIASEF